MFSRTRFVMTIQALLVVLLCAVPGRAQDTEGIHWLHDLDEAMRLSAADGRPVIAYFTFNACVWCHKLEDDTFSDASVIEMSRQFIWVKINRDDTPEIPPRFNMSAYPSLITLGRNQEKVHRFSSYMLPDEFKSNLADALRRYDLYKAGEEWDEPEPRPQRLCDDRSIKISTFKAPSEEVPAGLASLNDSMWIAQMGSLFECDLDGQVKRTFPLHNSVLDLCTDGTNLYAMTSGWTAGQPIYIINPQTGETTGSIITEANKANRSHGAKGVTWIDGRLFVLEGMNGIIHEIDPGSGDILNSIQTSARWLTGLAWDGKNFITSSKEQLLLFDRQGRQTNAVAVHYPLRSVGWRAGADVAGGSVFLMEQPIFDYGKQHERVRLWPREMLVYRLQFAGEKEPPADPLGSRTNPIRCDMPSGERAYLARLRCADGSTPTFSRVGSYGAGPDGHVLDGYKVISPGGAEVVLFFDMYHPEHVEAGAASGFTIIDQ